MTPPETCDTTVEVDPLEIDPIEVRHHGECLSLSGRSTLTFAIAYSADRDR